MRYWGRRLSGRQAGRQAMVFAAVLLRECWMKANHEASSLARHLTCHHRSCPFHKRLGGSKASELSSCWAPCILAPCCIPCRAIRRFCGIGNIPKPINGLHSTQWNPCPTEDDQSQWLYNSPDGCMMIQQRAPACQQPFNLLVGFKHTGMCSPLMCAHIVWRTSDLTHKFC